MGDLTSIICDFKYRDKKYDSIVYLVILNATAPAHHPLLDASAPSRPCDPEGNSTSLAPST